MRFVAPSGLLICWLIAPCCTAGDDADRFLEVAKRLIQAINNDDSPAIQRGYDAQMRLSFPPEKATPFFRGLVSAKGKLQRADLLQVTGPSAIVRVTAERGAWDFTISLDASDKIAGLLVAPPGPEVPRSRTAMRLPFRGEWSVFWGGDSKQVNNHADVRGQRRAADLTIEGPAGLTHRGAGRRNEDYFAYGQEILAAAPGTVVTAIDGIPDNQPGSMNPLCAIGNCLIIDQGSGEFAVYGHLKPGSLGVRRGDKVRAGQVVALCGNSGNSSEPHLHFHLQDDAILQDGAGIAPFFTDVRCRRGGTTLTEPRYTFLKGDHVQSVPK